MTAVADGPSGAAGNTESLGLFVERLESNKLGGFGELPDLRRLPCFDFRWAHKLHLSFVFYLPKSGAHFLKQRSPISRKASAWRRVAGSELANAAMTVFDAFKKSMQYGRLILRQ